MHAKGSVTWEFEAQPGPGDTHFSVVPNMLTQYATITQAYEMSR